MIDQLCIIATGVTAVFLTQSKSEHARRWAPVFGLAGQPFWMYAATVAGQWGILAISLLYTAAWCKGIYQNFLK